MWGTFIRKKLREFLEFECLRPYVMKEIKACPFIAFGLGLMTSHVSHAKGVIEKKKK